MKKHYLFLPFLFSIVLSISAQEKKAELVDEFPTLNCEDLLARSDNFAGLLKKDSNLKLYIIYYEGKHPQEVYDKKEKKMKTIRVAPRRGEARNKTEAISLYLTKYSNISTDRFTLVDGGFDTEYRVQVWLISSGVEPPKHSPSENIKMMKFRKGKAPKVADCEGYYRSI